MSFRLLFLFLSSICFSLFKHSFGTESAYFECAQPVLSDSETLKCSGQGDPISGAYGWFFAPRIDLNKAQWADLVLIRGVGSKLANQIVSFRARKGRIESWDAVLEVRGIGPKMLQRLRTFFYISPNG